VDSDLATSGLLWKHPADVPRHDESATGTTLRRLLRKFRRCSWVGAHLGYDAVSTTSRGGAPPNGSRLSCGALKNDSFLNLRAPPASSAC